MATLSLHIVRGGRRVLGIKRGGGGGGGGGV